MTEEVARFRAAHGPGVNRGEQGSSLERPFFGWFLCQPCWWLTPKHAGNRRSHFAFSKATRRGQQSPSAHRIDRTGQYQKGRNHSVRSNRVRTLTCCPVKLDHSATARKEQFQAAGGGGWMSVPIVLAKARSVSNCPRLEIRKREAMNTWPLLSPSTISSVNTTGDTRSANLLNL